MLTAAGWAIHDEVRSLRSMQGNRGKTTFAVPKGTVGVVCGMSGGLLVVKFPEGPVSIANPAKLVSKMAAEGAEPSAPENPKKLKVPPGHPYLKVGQWQTIFHTRSASGRPASTSKKHSIVEKGKLKSCYTNRRQAAASP